MVPSQAHPQVKKVQLRKESGNMVKGKKSIPALKKEKSHPHLLPFLSSKIGTDSVFDIQKQKCCKVNKSPPLHHKKWQIKAFEYQEVLKISTVWRCQFDPSRSVCSCFLWRPQLTGCVCVQSVSLKSTLEEEQFAVRGQQVAVWTLEAHCGSIKACPRSDSVILWPMKPAERNHDNEVRQCSFRLSNFRAGFTFVQNETS